MEKDQIVLPVLLVGMVVGLFVGVVFIARAMGLIGIGISVDLLGVVRFERVFNALEGFVVGIVALPVGLALAYIGLKILHVSRAYFLTAIFVSVELLATVAYIAAAGGDPDFSIWLSGMAVSWWVFLYFIGEIED